ncbi:MAG: zinc ribbon domain-containing protein [Theionarchaea archaeon]|nr:MAG: hypothetical protein AYK19_17765 [Theionarchaea archaeon DG-70-1]MBU7026120.1 zinc ribbon domain-containing protein [Theionarchaea archaeon]
MDERVKAGLEAGVVSLLFFWTGYLTFLLAGFLAVDFGEKVIRNTKDVIVSSLVAAIPCMALYFFIFNYVGDYLGGIFVMPTVAAAVSLGAGLFRAKLRLRIPLSLKDILKIPLVHRTLCPICGEKVEKNWKFCPNCKSSLELIVCPHCGRANSSTAARCQTCGGSLAEGTKVY